MNESDVRDLLLTAANSTCGLARQDRFTKLVEYGLQMTGGTMRENVQDGDEPGIFVPLELHSANQWEQATFLSLQDRAVIAWWTGTVQLKHFGTVVPYDDIERIETVATEPRTWRRPERATLSVEGKNPVTLRVVRLTDGVDLAKLVEFALLGAVGLDDS